MIKRYEKKLKWSYEWEFYIERIIGCPVLLYSIEWAHKVARNRNSHSN